MHLDADAPFGEKLEMSDEVTVTRFAQEMARLFRTHTSSEPLGDIGALSLDQAYLVQDRFVADRLHSSGRVVGWKVGCTSPAIRRQFGLEQPISGRLFERELESDGAELAASRYVNCAVEPELVLRLGSDLEGDVSETEILRSLRSIAVGIEIHNHRFWYGAPTSQELIASNGIHAGLVVGTEIPLPEELDLNRETASLAVNGLAKASAPCVEILGGPLRSVQWLARHAASRGLKLRAGELVIPGSAVELIRVRAGDSIEARISSVGTCRAHLT